MLSIFWRQKYLVGAFKNGTLWAEHEFVFVIRRINNVVYNSGHSSNLSMSIIILYAFYKVLLFLVGIHSCFILLN